MGKYVFERHFDGDDQKNAILAPLINCHDPGKTVSRGHQTYTVSGSFNNAEQIFIDVSSNKFYSTTEYSKKKIKLTLRSMHFRGITVGLFIMPLVIYHLA